MMLVQMCFSLDPRVNGSQPITGLDVQANTWSDCDWAATKLVSVLVSVRFAI